MKHHPWKWIAVVTVLAAAVGLICLLGRGSLFEATAKIWSRFSDPEQLTALVTGFGAGAPVVFILIQTAQVVLAPIPGEATGFIGGYLFGFFPGLVYSTLGLSLGSWLNLALGRLLGRRYVRGLIPGRHLERFDAMLARKGLMVVFLLFVFPGFPKDYLCLFLGISNMPLRALLVIAVVGRIPGTMMLSLQGSLLFERDYFLLGIAVAVFAAAGGLFYLGRNRFYQWVEKVGRGEAADR